ncbi:hypothetical protein OIDMADRAFT_46844 [Oidiodendron maius Zn]|uniref:DUF7730 domain-containing protein n=1 Tax=Oidiodendron maius (strain Zn) TaxID=913774 RepID=A0A0C3DXT7_OIDMZ|nr:hypothetical protein OIDMADRAFT_46844 [Oidiodendron maius Zn]
MPFKRKDIAKAFFDLDISDSEPSTASQTPKPRDRNRLIASKPPLDKVEGNDKVALLTLPIEIRLRIYDLLVISRFDRTQNPSWAVGNTDQKLILLHMGQFRQYRTMEPGILQTCKQIYHEANSILYSQNIFAISEPEQMFRLIVQIGLVNLKLVKTLRIWVPYMAELFPWLQLLYILAEEASGLRCIELGWGADCEFPWQLGRGARERGLGDSLDFVRALGNIRGLKKLVIKGYYAKRWPAYLEERMGVRVRAICGHCREEPELKEGDLIYEEWNKKELQTFMEYQQGTEDLIP